jgi:Protein of unknown function DUF262
MATSSFCELFRSKTTEMLTITSLAEWRQAKEGSRLLLPPIQRSVVWSNEQVINYWDSLLRGYSAGMMMVHRIQQGQGDASHKGRDEDDLTLEASEGDFQLFDGQQRMAAVLLGLAKGQMKDTRRIWADLGTEPNKGAGLRFQLRMTSTGQPFGYRPDAPNQKIELGKRREAWGNWLKNHIGQDARQKAFADVASRDIMDAKCAVPLALVYQLITKFNNCDAVIEELSNFEGASEKIIRDLVKQFDEALSSEVIVQQVDQKVVANQEEYIRFFKRLGQGGTRLSDDELTYSIIKHQYPRIHDRMLGIMHESGRRAGEVNLVLAALRVAKTLAPWPYAKEWEIIGRPDPNFVVALKDKTEVLEEFLAMIPQEDQTAKLATVLRRIRQALSYNQDVRPKGLPDVLLARLPRELIDVLILFAVKQGVEEVWHEDVCETLCAFVLHWLLFVRNDANAAWLAFQHAANKEWAFTQTSIKKLVSEYEQDGVASFIPRRDAMGDLRREVVERDHVLRPWAERFISADRDSAIKPGEALRLLSTNRELCMRALMWLQRVYIAREWPSYDPTSDRDEDLPIDLDHIIPSALFAFDWRNAKKRLTKEAISDTFFVSGAP